MTREEIDRAGAHILATSVHELTWADGFETGVKFTEEKTAERTKKEIIHKACEWLENNKHLHKVLSFGSLSTDWDKFIREFRKAMEL